MLVSVSPYFKVVYILVVSGRLRRIVFTNYCSYCCP